MSDIDNNRTCHIVLYTPAKQAPGEKGYKGRRFEDRHDGRGHEQAVAFAKGVEEAGGYVLGLFHQCRPLGVYFGDAPSWKEPGT